MGKWNGLPHEPQYLCGAYARTTGEPCKRFARKNGRCKLHGGASTGAKRPHIKHGLYTKDAIELSRHYKCLVSEINTLIEQMDINQND